MGGSEGEREVGTEGVREKGWDYGTVRLTVRGWGGRESNYSESSTEWREARQAKERVHYKNDGDLERAPTNEAHQMPLSAPTSPPSQVGGPNPPPLLPPKWGPQPPQLPSTTSTPSMQNSRSEYLPIFYHCYDPSNSPPFSHLFLCHPHPPSPPSACLPPCQPVSASHVPSGWQCLRARHALPHIGARQAAQRHGLRPLPQPGAAHKEGEHR